MSVKWTVVWVVMWMKRKVERKSLKVASGVIYVAYDTAHSLDLHKQAVKEGTRITRTLFIGNKLNKAAT